MADSGGAKEIQVDYSRLRVPFGPVHPALKEPISLRVTVRREEVVDVDVQLGHVHRGIEALAEHRNLAQALYLVERICGICSHSHTTCFIQALERIGGITPSARSLYLRTLIFELERLHSHLLILGVMAYEVGFDTLFMFAWHAREDVLDLFEEITGNRVHHSMNTLGGVRWDVSPQHLDKLTQSANKLEKAANYLRDVFQDRTVEKRLCGVGVLAREAARDLCAVGPIARGSGLDTDVRVDHPHAAYGDLKDSFAVAVRDGGDAYARTEVRLLELFESINIIRTIADALPPGPTKLETNVLRLKKDIPAGETVSVVEAPRGELLHYVKTNGKDGLHRLKIRTPTNANVLSLKPMLIGGELADIPVALASIDPCMSCTNRLVVVDAEQHAETVMDLDRLRRQRRPPCTR